MRFLSTLVCLLLVAGPVMAAPSVPEAEQAAQEAKADRAAAQRHYDRRAAIAQDVSARLDATMVRYEATLYEVEAATFAAIETRTELESAQRTVNLLNDSVQTGAASVYMSRVAGNGPIPILSSSLESAAVIGDFLARVNESALRDIGRLEVARTRLQVLGERRDEAKTELEASYRKLQVLETELEGLLEQADREAAAALRGVERADDQYRQSLKDLEEARRLAWLTEGVEHWRPLVDKYFPPRLVLQALAVMRCESGGNPDAVNASSGASGLFQFMAGTWAWTSVKAGFPGASRFDPEANVAAAAYLVDYSIRTNHPGGPWGRWSCQPPPGL